MIIPAQTVARKATGKGGNVLYVAVPPHFDRLSATPALSHWEWGIRKQPGREPASNAAMFIVEIKHTSGMKHRQHCGRAPPENRCCCSCCSGGCCCGSQHARCLHCCSTSRRADPLTLAQRFAYAAKTLKPISATPPIDSQPPSIAE